MKLKDLDPCRYNERKNKYKTLRETWNQATNKDKFWLILKCRSHGSMSRKEFISLLLNYIKPIEVLMPKKSIDCINQLRDWINGKEVDLHEVRDTAYAAYSAYSVYSVSHAAASAYSAARAASSTYFVYSSTYFAYSASHAADAVADAVAADVAVDAKNIELTIPISLEKVCEYLNLDINEVLE